MSRTQDRFYADTAHNGGHIHDGAVELGVLSSATAPVLTNNGANDFSWNRTAGGAETIHVFKGLDILRRITESYQSESAFQEGFNMGPPFVGRPPIAGFPLTPPSAAGPAKGFQVDDVYLVYRVGVAGLTSIALSLAEIKMGENAARVVTAIATTSNPPLGAQANDHVATFKVTAPAMIVDDFSDIQADFTIVMANTGTLRIYGIGWHGHFNYN